GRNWRNADLWFDSVGLLLSGAGDPLGFDVTPAGFPGAHFACVDAETECLTVGGWRRYHELHEGQPIFSFNMETQRLEIEPLQKVATYDYTGNLVAVFGRSSNMLLTPNHRCVVRRRNKKGGFSRPGIVRADALRPGMVFPVAAILPDDGLPVPPEP